MLFRVKFEVPNAHLGRNGEWAVRYINQSSKGKVWAEESPREMYTCRKRRLGTKSCCTVELRG